MNNKKNQKKSKRVNQRNQIKSMVKSIVDSKIQNEIKYIDYTGDTSGTSGGVQAFSLPALGTNVDERIGLAIKLDNILMRICFNVEEATTISNTTASNTYIRYSVIQIIGEEVPTADDIYDNTATAAGTIVSPFSYSNKNKLFHVLHDEVVLIDSFNRSYFKDQFIKPKISKLRYDTNNNQYSTGQLYLITTYKSEGAAPNIRQIWQFRSFYYNM